MKRYSFILLFIILLLPLWGNISVQIRGENRPRSIAVQDISGINYVDTEQLGLAFKSIIKHEYVDRKVFLYIYGEQFIFLLDTSYYTFNNTHYNMHYPALHRQGKVFLPALFVSEHLAQRLTPKITRVGNGLQAVPPPDKSVSTIVLDPGHGGRDPGAVGRTLRALEKDINLAVAQKLKLLLERELGVRVLMTRDHDVYMTLGERTRFANDNHADLFISIHTNSSQGRAGHGLETYYLSTAGTTDSRAVEALENNVVELYEGAEARQQYDALAFILSDLSQTEHLENSNTLATLVHQNMVAGTRAQDRGVRQANFFVLRGAFMPAILVEMGFISNEDEEARLVSAQYQDRISRTIFEGIKRFKYRYDRIRNT